MTTSEWMLGVRIVFLIVQTLVIGFALRLLLRMRRDAKIAENERMLRGPSTRAPDDDNGYPG